MTNDLPTRKAELAKLLEETKARTEQEKRQAEADMALKAEEHKIAIRLKDDELVQLREEAKHKLANSEEYQRLVGRVEELETQIQSGEQDKEAMYNELMALKEAKEQGRLQPV